ncbi:uncharacterized protein LOC120119092 [Hibiscus syriacus]|uniref:uncharacterized protein LOC120119092 n=1 Tax=Hibiscus syriacus TaxID=106335 RepID=UPI001921B856|nr:uncharacterized protein LOC120119092 [Hibiscus syriacus]
MVILNRLPTKDRLIRFGLEMDNGCIMCGNGLETRDHLFANCSFAKEVWDAVLVVCGIRSGLYNWDERMDWLVENLRGKSPRVRFLKLAWTVYLYHIWEERNHRVFRRVSRSVDAVVTKIKETVHYKLYRHSTHRRDDVYRHLYMSWGLI